MLSVLTALDSRRRFHEAPVDSQALLPVAPVVPQDQFSTVSADAGQQVATAGSGTIDLDAIVIAIATGSDRQVQFVLQVKKH